MDAILVINFLNAQVASGQPTRSVAAPTDSSAAALSTATTLSLPGQMDAGAKMSPVEAAVAELYAGEPDAHWLNALADAQQNKTARP